MKLELNDYHKLTNSIKMRSVEYRSKLNLAREECSKQFKRLREQRLARESKSRS